MKTSTFKLFAALVAASALFATLPAEAGHDRRDHREWRHDHRGYGPGYVYGNRHPGARHKHGSRVVSRHVVREYHYYEPVVTRRYVQPAPVYYPSYARDPAIVIGVSIPPIVIPIR